MIFVEKAFDSYQKEAFSYRFTLVSYHFPTFSYPFTVNSYHNLVNSYLFFHFFAQKSGKTGKKRQGNGKK